MESDALMRAKDNYVPYLLRKKTSTELFCDSSLTTGRFFLGGGQQSSFETAVMY